MTHRRRLEPRRRLLPIGANPAACKDMKFNPWEIPADLALRRYIIGAYIYEHVPGGEWLSDLEWDQLYLRIKMDWENITHPHKKLLDPNNLRSAAHIPEHEFPMIVVMAAAQILEQQIPMSRKRTARWNKPIEKRYPMIYGNITHEEIKENATSKSDARIRRKLDSKKQFTLF